MILTKKFEILHFEVYLDFMNNLRAALVNLIVSFGMKAKDSNSQKTHDISLKAGYSEKLIELEKNISRLN